jgi:hypothetical protein
MHEHALEQKEPFETFGLAVPERELLSGIGGILLGSKKVGLLWILIGE